MWCGAYPVGIWLKPPTIVIWPPGWAMLESTFPMLDGIEEYPYDLLAYGFGTGMWEDASAGMLREP